MKRLLSRRNVRSLSIFLILSPAVYFFVMLFLGYEAPVYLYGSICAAVILLGVLLLLFSRRMTDIEKPLTRREMTLRLTVTAVMLGMVAICKTFQFNIPIFGASGMNVGLSGIFTAFPALLFGPLYGGAASACADILGCIIAPTGAYNPLFTLTAFLGGFLKGFLWMLLRGRKTAAMRTVAAVVLCVLAITGVGTHLSLASDGVSTQFIATADAMPLKQDATASAKSPLSVLAVSLAQYSNDSYTLTYADTVSGDITVPAKLLAADGSSYVPRIGANAFGSQIQTITLPDGLKTVHANAFASCPQATVFCTEATAKLLQGLDTVPVISLIEETPALTVSLDGSEAFNAVSSRTYEKTLAGYINFLTVGFEATALLGGLLILAELLYARRRNATGKQGGNGVRIFLTLFASGLLVTTLNTWILMVLYWLSRAFWIVWIPRAAEELIMTILQAYFVTLLYDIYRTRFAGKSDHWAS